MAQSAFSPFLPALDLLQTSENKIKMLSTASQLSLGFAPQLAVQHAASRAAAPLMQVKSCAGTRPLPVQPAQTRAASSEGC